MPDARRPARNTLPATSVRDFRQLLDAALSERDDQGRRWADARWGSYAFYDYDGEPIYVGQTNERLRTRVRRHLTNQRTDAVAMRILDVFEVAELELRPLWEFEDVTKRADPDRFREAQAKLDSVEYTAYLDAIVLSKFGAILNEKIPPVSPTFHLPPARRCQLVSAETRAERGHPDVRIARRAETISRLAAVAHERGEVSDGLRRVLVVQAVRLAHLSATRLAQVEGRDAPPADAINISGLVGSLLYEGDEDPLEAQDADTRGDEA